MKDFATVRAMVGGVKGVMKKLGDDPPHEHKWKNLPKCPFCSNKDCAGVFNKGGVDFFKCHHTGCSSGGAVLAEVGYVAMREGLSETPPAGGGPSPAYRRFLELADCWEEPAEKKKKENKTDTSPRVENSTPHPGPLPIAPPTPQRGEGEAALPNPVLPPETPRPAPPPPTETMDPEALIMAKAMELIRYENKASVRSLQKHLSLGFARATRIMEELEKRGVVGPAKDGEPREILKLPEKGNWLVVKIGDEITIESATAPTPQPGPLPIAPPTPQRGEGEGNGKHSTCNIQHATANDAAAGEKAKEKKADELPLGMAVLRAFNEKLFPTESELKGFLESGEPVPDPLPAAAAKKLKFKPVTLMAKRGLTSVTCAAVGLRANPPANEAVMQELDQQFAWEEKRASGLWLEADKKRKLGRRPNAQFYGKGQMGKKPEKERRGKEDKWVWGFCSPVLIPFFDEAGALLKLRPHKGGAPTGTIAGRPRIYVPRDYRNCGDIVERFYEVVICEGEYKALALWQEIGLGAKLQKNSPAAEDPRFEPVGICALPGISYVTNVEMRMDLERWLVDVGARRVIVAFDDEDKSDKPLRQRFDAQRDARVLAIELAKALHVEARVCVLPVEWRNRRGKADWDGALAMLAETSNIQHPKSSNQSGEHLTPALSPLASEANAEREKKNRGGRA